MAINSVRQLVDAELAGRSRQYTFRKTPSQVTTAGIWFDLAMSPGNPPPKYWFDAPPGIAQQVKQSTDGGFFHGSNVTPFSKYLRSTRVQNSVVTALPMKFVLCDYLLYYPSIDESSSDEQFLTNTNTLPRYTDGAGVQIMAISVAGGNSTGVFTVNYTNSLGVSGRTTISLGIGAGTAVGTVKTSSTGFGAFPNGSGPFLPLQRGDIGVRSIESVTFSVTDVGLFSLVLVKPLASTQLLGIDAVVEKDYFLDEGAVPEIKDDAYLNFLMVPEGNSSTAVILGDLKVIYN